MSTTSTLDRMTCAHGMPNPAACIDCMADGVSLPSTARKARTGQNGIGGYALSNDCSVQAITNALGVSYADAAAALRSAGWVPGRGATQAQIATAVESFGFALRSTGLDFAAALRSGGTYIVCAFAGRKGHAWTIDAGTHHNAGVWVARRFSIRFTILEVTV